MLPEYYYGEDIFWGPSTPRRSENKMAEEADKRKRFKRLSDKDLLEEFKMNLRKLNSIASEVTGEYEDCVEIKNAAERILDENKVALEMVNATMKDEYNAQRIRDSINADSWLTKANVFVVRLTEDLTFMHKTLSEAYREAEILKKKIEAKNIIDLM